MNPVSRHWSCPGCERSITEACCGAPIKLCGLCELLPAHKVLAYAERWKLTEAQRLAYQRGIDRLKRRA